MTNLLIDGLPDTLQLDGQTIPINTGFRLWMKLNILLTNGSPGEEVTALLLSIVQLEPDKLVEIITGKEADFMDAVGAFLLGPSQEEREPDGRRQVFSLEYDTPFIIGAFKQAYGLDLVHSEMHWWEFLNYLMTLPRNTELMERIQIRSINATKIKDRQERARIRKLQRALAIPQRKLTAEEMGAQL